ncbi:MAG: P1 family peptidase [Defluviitaleaceae bacterium]|nr:P1 family peptidase [Defluviitaleaceae bacterium]
MANSQKQFKRIRDWMEIPGGYLPGPRNSITDVPGVTCAHVTLAEVGVRTGLTLISPCESDVFLNPLPAAVETGNGFGKLTGALQVEELGEIESLIGLTNTLSVAAVLQGLVDYHAPKLPDEYNSVNIVVGETNDSRLNDIRGCHVKPAHVAEAVALLSKDVVEGDIGAGAGTVSFGFKGGIGTASRVIPRNITGEAEDFTLGALVQSNYGGNLTIYGHAIPKPEEPAARENGSCMIVIITDAPLSSRQLKRLAKRGLIGMTNTGSVMSNGSGDFAVASSNFTQNRRKRSARGQHYYYLSDDQLNSFFEAAADAVQEALYNSMTMASGASRGNSIFPGLNPAQYSEILPLIVN